MELAETLRISLDALAANKVRSALTMLGVIIGVAAVIVLVSLGGGARQYIKNELGDLGTNILVVVPGKTSKEGGMPMGASSVRKLVYDDSVLLEKRSSSIMYAVPVLLGTSWARYQGKTRDTYVIGVTEEYFEVRNLKIDIGRQFETSEVEAGRHVCVMGRTVKRDIFGDVNALGAMITIGDVKFRVVGIMAPKGMALGNDFDDIIFIPVSAARELFDTDSLFNITVKVKDQDMIGKAKAEIREILMRRHAGQEDFTILSQDEMLNVMNRILSIMTAVLSGIAAISLLVGGIGIMNIMLVSVRERTREIGIRKALGAKNRDILLQFLMESVTLSLSGGLIGILMGVMFSLMVPFVITFLPTTIELWSIVLAFLFSMAVGVFFGVYPARKAALCDPIVALRYE